MSDDQGVPELQGPPEVIEAIDRFLADPSSGVQAGRPKRKTVDDEVEDAEIEHPEEDESKFIDRNWMLILGLGVVVLGLLIRWLVKRR